MKKFVIMIANLFIIAVNYAINFVEVATKKIKMVHCEMYMMQCWESNRYHCNCKYFTLLIFFFPLLQTGRKEKGDPLNSAIDKMTKKTRDLRRQVSTSFILQLIFPLKYLIYLLSNQLKT